jgi:hypothetical protein
MARDCLKYGTCKLHGTRAFVSWRTVGTNGEFGSCFKLKLKLFNEVTNTERSGESTHFV